MFLSFLCAAAIAQQPPPVAVAEAQSRNVLDQIQVTGSVVSLADALLSTTVAGRVEALEADVGRRVETGDPLLRLDTALEQSTLEAARAARDEAEAALADARRRLREARDLGPNRGIPETEVRSLEAEVRMDEAVLARLSAEARRQALVLERHVLRAPYAGVVSRRLVDPGEWVTPGSGVMGLVALDRLRLDFAVAQQHFPRLKKDTPVRVRLDALPEQTLPAVIEAIVPVNDPEARTFLVRARLEGAGQVPITPGMSVRATLSVDTGRTSVVIPRDALLRHPDGRITVWVLPDGGDQGAVSERQVEIGLTFDGRVEVRDGLAAGETVVVRGNEALRDGQQVRVTARVGG